MKMKIADMEALLDIYTTHTAEMMILETMQDREQRQKAMIRAEHRSLQKMGELGIRRGYIEKYDPKEQTNADSIFADTNAINRVTSDMNEEDLINAGRRLIRKINQ